MPRRSRNFSQRHKAVKADIVGLHGHTILHRPTERRTWQLGDGDGLAHRLGIDVVADFRSADVAAGGEGAPLAPLFHAALAAALPKPLAVLNLGGVANVSWIGGAEDILAFDTGPGNALIDDWVRRHTGAAGRYRWRARRRRTRFRGACRPLSGAAFLRPQAAEIARPRRFSRCHARGSFAGRRRRHPDRDDGRRGRGGAAGISRRRRASGWSAAAGDTTRR